MNKHKP